MLALDLLANFHHNLQKGHTSWSKIKNFVHNRIVHSFPISSAGWIWLLKEGHKKRAVIHWQAVAAVRLTKHQLRRATHGTVTYTGLSAQVCRHRSVRLGQIVGKIKRTGSARNVSSNWRLYNEENDNGKPWATIDHHTPCFLFLEQGVSSPSESSKSGIWEISFYSYVQGGRARYDQPSIQSKHAQQLSLMPVSDKRCMPLTLLVKGAEADGTEDYFHRVA